MKYYSRFKGEKEVEELTKERTQFLLERYYTKEFVDDVIDNERGFRLQTIMREIWTETDDGLVPIAGFYGIVG